MRDRNYLAEMDQLIAEATEGSSWVAPVIAAKLYAELLENDPELIDGWLHIVGTDALSRAIRGKAAAARARERNRARRGEFADSARNFEKGEDSYGVKLLGLFAVMHVVNGDEVRKRAGEMTGADHLYVSERYRARGETALMEAAFHRAVAEKVGDRRTDEAMSLTDYQRLYQSIAGASTD